ncbi:conserved protein of unknown function [Nitrospira japonica]|uniref:DUF4136 domain-containing protein n=1 Tax=Nitrospira japonica TaxID=1325564 RepID=A0A1W1I7D7_9BACT|nr:DUF4136 domain-containing protein [Nitrospira japonica]SLM48932.1 conserved protein of unknown function [Nitrospira japonica]
MARRNFLHYCLIIWSLSGCASYKVGYDYDRSVDFHSYRTYEWMRDQQEKTGDRRVDSSSTDIRVRTAIAAQLGLKGYAASTAGRPDFLVAYYIQVKEGPADQSQQYFSDGMAGKPFVHSVDTRNPSGKPKAEPEAPSYAAGTLLVDIIDASSKKLAWRGTAAGTVDPSLSSQERDERIRIILRDVLSNFPPKK